MAKEKWAETKIQATAFADRVGTESREAWNAHVLPTLRNWREEWNVRSQAGMKGFVEGARDAWMATMTWIVRNQRWTEARLSQPDVPEVVRTHAADVANALFLGVPAFAMVLFWNGVAYYCCFRGGATDLLGDVAGAGAGAETAAAVVADAGVASSSSPQPGQGRRRKASSSETGSHRRVNSSVSQQSVDVDADVDDDVSDARAAIRGFIAVSPATAPSSTDDVVVSPEEDNVGADGDGDGDDVDVDVVGGGVGANVDADDNDDATTSSSVGRLGAETKVESEAKSSASSASSSKGSNKPSRRSGSGRR